MKIAFRADASISQGAGHFVRSLTLATEFRCSGHDVIMIGSIDGVPWLTEMVRKSDVDWKSCSPHIIDQASIVKGRFDLLVVDSYEIPHTAINTASGMVPIMAIVDNNMRNIAPNLLLDHNLGAAPYQTHSETTQLTGPSYALVRQAIREIRRESSTRISNGTRPNVLVMIGGTDPSNLALKLSRLLSNLDSEYSFHFVTSKENMKEISTWFPGNRANIHLQSSEIEEVLKLADFAISAAGTSCLDLSAIGIPTIYISVADNQNSSLEIISKRNLGMTLGQAKDIESRKARLIRSLELCAYDNELRELFFRNSQNLVDGNGSRRVVGRVIEVIENQ